MLDCSHHYCPRCGEHYDSETRHGYGFCAYPKDEAMEQKDVSKLLNETGGKPALPPLPFKAEKPKEKK
jgi:hypothetical protein